MDAQTHRQTDIKVEIMVQPIRYFMYVFLAKERYLLSSLPYSSARLYMHRRHYQLQAYRHRQALQPGRMMGSWRMGGQAGRWQAYGVTGQEQTSYNVRNNASLRSCIHEWQKWHIQNHPRRA